MKPLLSIKEGEVMVQTDHSTKKLLTNLDLTIYPEDFIVVLGGNGAGKSTLFNVLSGNLKLTAGDIVYQDQSINHLSEEKRATFLSRVFQDPKMGTAPRLTVSENLLFSKKRGEKRRFKRRKIKDYQQEFYDLTKSLGNHLETHLDTPAGQLSGGQRQSLSLLMATIRRPDLLLLDEHTAALDPKTSEQLMAITNQKIQEDKLTCLMITHHMEDALKYGNRLLVLKEGEIVADFSEKEKENLKKKDLLSFFY